MSSPDGRERYRRPVAVLRPRSRWAPVHLRELWRYRDVFSSLAGRDIKLRYRQTFLGVVWVALQPLAGAGILAFVFGRVAGLSSEGIPYVAFALAGMLGWTFFSETVSKASTAFVSNPTLVSKVYFPRLLLPLSALGGSLLDLGVGTVLMAVLMAVYGITPTIGLLLVPVWVLLIAAYAVGIGAAFSSLTVRYRDVQYTLPVALQLLLFASPVAYSTSAVPDGAKAIVGLNPLAGLFDAMRWSIVGASRPTAAALVWATAGAVTVLLVGTAVFARTERSFADVI